MIWVASFSIGANVIAIPLCFWLMFSAQRCYRYAAEQARQLPVGHPAGIAYSDMASVITLSGKAKPRHWPDARGGGKRT